MAPDLRAAGILRVQAGSIGFELTPWMPAAPSKGDEDEGDPNPRGLHDPVLYPGGRVPRLEPPPPRRPRGEEPYDGDES